MYLYGVELIETSGSVANWTREKCYSGNSLNMG